MAEQSATFSPIRAALTIGVLTAFAVALIVALEWRSDSEEKRQAAESEAARAREARLASVREALGAYTVSLQSELPPDYGIRPVRGKLLVVGANAGELASIAAGEFVAADHLSSIHAYLPPHLQASDASEVGAVVCIGFHSQTTTYVVHYGERDEFDKFFDEFFSEHQPGTSIVYNLSVYDSADGALLHTAEVRTDSGDPKPIVEYLTRLTQPDDP